MFLMAEDIWTALFLPGTLIAVLTSTRPQGFGEGCLPAAVSMCVTGTLPGVHSVTGGVLWSWGDQGQAQEPHFPHLLPILAKLQSSTSLTHPSLLTWPNPSLEFFNLHPNPFCSLFPVPVYCCTYTSSLHFHSEDYKIKFTITIKITMQISVKIKSFHTLVKSEQRSFYTKEKKKEKLLDFKQSIHS